MVHTLSIVLAVLQFCSYVLLSTALQWRYYYRHIDQAQQWKIQPNKMRLILQPPPSPAAITSLSTLPSPSPSSPPPSSPLPPNQFSTPIHPSPSPSPSPSPLSPPPPSSLLPPFLTAWAYPTKWLLLPSLPPPPHRHPLQPLLTTLNLLLSSLFLLLLTEAHLHTPHPLTSLSPHPSLPPYLTLPLSILLQCVLEYYWHRLQHLPPLYRHVHKLHHYYTSPQPFDDLMIHPLEAAGYYCILYSPAFLIRQTVGSFVGYMAVLGVLGVVDHCGVRWRVWGGWLYDSAEHDEHHRCFNVNYSFPFSFMDRLHGTYKAPQPPPPLQQKVSEHHS